MSNSFYNRTFDVLPGNRIGSQSLEDQFMLVERGFDLFPSPLAIWGGSATFYRDTGAVNTMTISASSNVTAYAAGQCFLIRAAAANTGATTLSVNALGSRPVVRVDGSALQANDFALGQIIAVVYDDLNLRFQLVSGAGYSSVTPASIAANTPIIGAQLYLQANYGVL